MNQLQDEKESLLTQLLVSVRSAEEAALAAHAGVRWIDVKEPNLGSLGAASNKVLKEVVQVCDQTVTVSAALGELLDYSPRNLPAGISYAKLGLARCAVRADWQEVWKRSLRHLFPETQPVAVVYADHALAGAPQPGEVIAAGRKLGCPYVLVDTFDKTRGNLLDLWTWEEITQIVQEVQTLGMQIVLAGSLTQQCIQKLLPLRPAVLAVRGAACAGQRSAGLCPASLSRLVSLFPQLAEQAR